MNGTHHHHRRIIAKTLRPFHLLCAILLLCLPAVHEAWAVDPDYWEKKARQYYARMDCSGDVFGQIIKGLPLPRKISLLDSFLRILSWKCFYLECADRVILQAIPGELVSNQLQHPYPLGCHRFDFGKLRETDRCLIPDCFQIYYEGEIRASAP